MESTAHASSHRDLFPLVSRNVRPLSLGHSPFIIQGNPHKKMYFIHVGGMEKTKV